MGWPVADHLAIMVDEKAEVDVEHQDERPGKPVASQPLPLDWAALVAKSIHPTKVAILEAMAWLRRAVSPVELQRMFAENPDLLSNKDLSIISYHMTMLAKAGVVEKISERAVRGVRETFYFLTVTMTAETAGEDRDAQV